MNGWDLLPRIVALLAAAAAAGLLMRRLGQNAAVGYLLAGVLLGPTAAGLVRSAVDVEVLSELGVALLLFTIGLEFSFERLKQLGRVAVVGGSLQIGVTAVAVSGAATAFGVDSRAAIVLGLALAMSSTAIVLRELTDRARLDSTSGRNAIAILLMQDVAVIPILIVTDALSTSFGAGALLSEFVFRAFLVISFVAVSWAVARYLLPHILSAASTAGTRELPVVIAVCASLGSAWSAHVLGFSPSLGAFAAGLVLAELPFATQIRADITPLTAVFVTLFFASVGSAVRIPLDPTYLALAALMVVAVLIGKALIAGAATWLTQRSTRNAIITGLSVSQVGEFAFVIAGTAYRNGAFSETLFQLVLTVSLITLIATPFLIGWGPGLSARVLRSVPAKSRGSLEPQRTGSEWKRVIVIGYGPAGRTVVNKLRATGIPFVVLETNPNTVALCRVEIPIELGDATRTEVLQHAGAGASIAIIVTVPDPNACRVIVGVAQRLAPGVPIVARLRYHQFAQDLARAGADRVVDEEYTVGIRLAEEALAVSHAYNSSPAS